MADPPSSSPDSSSQSQLAMLQLANLISVPMALSTILKLNIPSLMHASPVPLSAAELLPGSEDPSLLQRLLRLLASFDVFEEHISHSESGELTRRYSLTPVGQTLVGSPNYGDYVLQHHQAALIRAWPELHLSVLDPTGPDPFRRANNGVPAYQYYGQDPEGNELMLKAMDGVSEPFMRRFLQGFKEGEGEELGFLGFKGVERLVDVGGSSGKCLEMIMKEVGTVKEGINFDLPDVVKAAPNIDGLWFEENSLWVRTRRRAMDESKVSVNRFDGRDFGYWKMQIEALLCQKDLDDALLETKPKHITDDDKWKKMNRKALSYIQLSLAKNVAFNVVKETTAFGIMKALSNTYEKASSLNKLHLVRRLFHLRMAEGGSAAEHLNAFQVISNQLDSFKFNLGDEMKALMLLQSLPESWATTVDVIGGKEDLTFEEVRDRILNEDIRRRERSEASDYSGSALSVETRGRRGQKGNKGGCSVSSGRSELECWSCGKKGHMKRDCTVPKEKRAESSFANVAIEEEDSDDALILCVDSLLSHGFLIQAHLSTRPRRKIRF